MVKERDEAQKRTQKAKARYDAEVRKLEEETVRFSWHVVEYTPGDHAGGYYDRYIQPKRVQVSPDFNTEDDAKRWMEAHEPDEGNSLYIQRMRLRKYTVLRWVDY